MCYSILAALGGFGIQFVSEKFSCNGVIRERLPAGNPALAIFSYTCETDDGQEKV